MQEIKKNTQLKWGGWKELQRVRIYLMEGGKIMKDKRVGMLT